MCLCVPGTSRDQKSTLQLLELELRVAQMLGSKPWSSGRAAALLTTERLSSLDACLIFKHLIYLFGKLHLCDFCSDINMGHGRHWGLCLLLFWDFCLTEVCRYQRDLFRSWQAKALSRRDPDWKGVQVRESLSVQRPEGVSGTQHPAQSR